MEPDALGGAGFAIEDLLLDGPAPLVEGTWNEKAWWILRKQAIDKVPADVLSETT